MGYIIKIPHRGIQKGNKTWIVNATKKNVKTVHIKKLREAKKPSGC